ncbi:unnamed protein product, partial [Mesorhabditis belari]|uniref:Uncharacterized protein n=1 Tax=Mesorhabditis belari TaxID=2138241 RepID=A0AAF3FLJ7_9BILA
MKDSLSTTAIAAFRLYNLVMISLSSCFCFAGLYVLLTEKLKDARAHTIYLVVTHIIVYAMEVDIVLTNPIGHLPNVAIVVQGVWLDLPINSIIFLNYAELIPSNVLYFNDDLNIYFRYFLGVYALYSVVFFFFVHILMDRVVPCFFNGHSVVMRMNTLYPRVKLLVKGYYSLLFRKVHVDRSTTMQVIEKKVEVLPAKR